jgi:hypothetical protein
LNLSSLTPSLQQCDEPRLPEMVISSQCFGDALLLHDDERDAIGDGQSLS